MTLENENPTNENNANPNNPNNTPPPAPKEDAMSILEKRLAEINARKSGATPGSNEPAAPVSPTAFAESMPAEPIAPAAAPATNSIPIPETKTEQPAPETNIENIEAGSISLPENMPRTETPASTETPVSAPDASTVAGGAVATHEVIPPAENPISQVSEPVVETNVSETEESTATITNEPAIGTFSGQSNTVSGGTTEAERDAALGDENTVGNVISGAIAAHEIIPEVMPAQRKAEEIENTGTGVAHISAEKTEETYELSTEDEQFTDTDYAAMPAAELERQLMAILKTDSRKNFRQVNDMYREYELKLAAEKNEAQERFIAEGGTADDFEYRLSPERQQLEKAIQQFRENRYRDQRSEEEQKQKNLQRKQELIAQLREVVEAAETKSSADKMKAIQEEWKAIGPVPQNESQQLWNSYHALLDIFYNNRSIYFELKELDRKRNLDAKLQLVARAEALEQNPSINASLQELRHLHEEWKNIGPVPNDQRDAIWERFIQASEKVHERKKEFMAGRREVETANLSKKTEVLNRLEVFQNYNTDRINDWRDKTDEIQKIKEEWDAIGLVPKENADVINKKFWGIYKAFFHNKNQFFKALDEQKMQNLKLKTELCEQAEAVKDSTDWDATKEQLIQLQKKWKTIGRVPDKYSDKIWERFRAACNEFFDRRQADAQHKEAELDKLSEEKTAYLDELTERISQHQHPQAGNLEHLKEMVTKWQSFDSGSGRSNAQAEEKFFALMEKYLDTVPELSNEQKTDVLFKLQMNKLKGGPDASNKLYQKEQSIRKEISQLENDIRTLKTNIEFFARSKNAEKLREEYDDRILQANSRIELLQKQLKEIRS
ncbi:DUF349 domain-containing protein [Adhaeribacter terreus]|uniref:DUF349 domain-containing protein n=1 Tax=Adhaeribacter terreus TaxID=529703 RepID=A0ABW0E795_9BACT